MFTEYNYRPNPASNGRYWVCVNPLKNFSPLLSQCLTDAANRLISTCQSDDYGLYTLLSNVRPLNKKLTNLSLASHHVKEATRYNQNDEPVSGNELEDYTVPQLIRFEKPSDAFVQADLSSTVRNEYHAWDDDAYEPGLITLLDLTNYRHQLEVFKRQNADACDSITNAAIDELDRLMADAVADIQRFVGFDIDISPEHDFGLDTHDQFKDDNLQKLADFRLVWWFDN